MRRRDRRGRRSQPVRSIAVVIYPITPSFAAEIGDVDLSCPIGPSDLAAVKEAFARLAVLIFPDQRLSQDPHLDLARHFGPLETTIALYRKNEPLRLRPEFADVSNLNQESKAHSTQRQFVYTHRWKCDMQRATVSDVANSCEQEGVAVATA